MYKTNIQTDRQTDRHKSFKLIVFLAAAAFPLLASQPTLTFACYPSCGSADTTSSSVTSPTISAVTTTQPSTTQTISTVPTPTLPPLDSVPIAAPIEPKPEVPDLVKVEDVKDGDGNVIGKKSTYDDGVVIGRLNDGSTFVDLPVGYIPPGQQTQIVIHADGKVTIFLSDENNNILSAKVYLPPPSSPGGCTDPGCPPQPQPY